MQLNIQRMRAVLLLCSAALVYSAEIYVSSSGNDNNDGSIGSPLATLAAARDKADNLKSGATPVTVYLRGGTYYLTAPVVFGPSNSGSASAPIVYSAYQTEKPVLSGGIKVTPVWSVYSGKIMVSTIDTGLKIDQLFLDGRRQIMCRYPDFDSTKHLDGYDADCIGAARVASWKDPTEGPGYLRGLHSNLWGGESYIITAKNDDNTVTLTWVGDNSQGNKLHATYRMVENIFEELDAPGEWFYRKSTGQLYYYPPEGTDLSMATIELASQDELIKIVGTTAQPVRYLQFKGLTFTHTYRTLFSQPYVPLLAGDWTIARAGALYIENAENIRVDDCFFDQIGGNGIFINGYNQHHVIANNTFIDGGATCVSICGFMSSARCARSLRSTVTCTDRTPGPLTNDYPSFITVENNLMDHLGRFEKQSAGVNISASMKDTIRHNTICRCPRAGINLTDGCWGGHEICYNWVYKSVLETLDHGPFNSWGRDRNMLWSGDTSATELDAMYTTNIHHNRLEAAPPLFGVDLDDGSSNYNVHDNLLIGVGLKLWHHRHNRYVNNIITSGGVTEMHDVYANSGDYYAHNITDDTCVYSFCCFADMSSAGIPIQVAARVPVFDSNCIWSMGRTPKMVQWLDRNIVTTTWENWLAAGLDAHSKLEDPQFVDTAKVFRPDYAPRGDYRVKPASPALTLGFVNFPMDSFGVMPVLNASLRRPSAKGRSLPGVSGRIRYARGRLIVYTTGDYKVTVTTPNGKAIAVFTGRGMHGFVLAQKRIAKGVYIAVLSSAQYHIAQRFLVN
jgi:hypothetical protein